MRAHKINIERSANLDVSRLNILCRRAIRATLQSEGVDICCTVDILFTNDKGMRVINQEKRGIDKSTDVLSFPLNTFTPGAFQAQPEDIDPETGRLHLGDIVVSVDHVKQQAREYGHDTTRETAYLIVHATLHLLGYDHEEEGAKRAMRMREEYILSALGQTR